MPTYDFCVPEAQRLADLTGIWSDLRLARSLTEKFLVDIRKGQVADYEHRLSLCISALVVFCRTTATGVRTKLPAELKSKLDANQQLELESFDDYRNKWAAHSVNALEEPCVTLELMSFNDNKVSATGIGVRISNTVSLSQEKMQALRKLCIKLQGIVDDEIQEERIRVLNIANREYDLQHLLNNPTTFGPPKQDQNVARRRKQFGS